MKGGGCIVAGRSRLLAVGSRYLVAVAAGNLLWEFLQLPLFTLWRTASPAEIVFAVLHCWIGDALIAFFALAVGVLLAGGGWPRRAYWRTAAIAITLGFAYTVFSEWLNVTVRGSWAYAAAMPRVPPLGTGLSPLLQWIIVPIAAFVWAREKISDSISHLEASK
jgi:hypothetical protein